jgi:hypothetical protein
VSQEIDIRQLDHPSSPCADHDCRPFIYDKGTLFVDLVDPHTHKVIWRGWAEGSIDGVIDHQAWLESRIDDAVAAILARLPNRLQTVRERSRTRLATCALSRAARRRARVTGVG